MTITRPVFRYGGSKFKIAPWIISHFPHHRVYVEPFCGSASVLMRKTAAANEILNDYEQRIIDIFRILRNPEKAERLKEVLWLTPYSRQEYYDTEPDDNDDEIEKARKLIARSFMGISPAMMFRGIGGFDSRFNNQKAYCAYPEKIIQFTERLREVPLENRDAMWVMKQYDTPQTLHYIDPPYKSDLWRKSDKIYTNILDDDYHAELLRFIKEELTGMVIISGYDNPQYREALKDWHFDSKITHNQRSQERLECIWIKPNAITAKQLTLNEV